MILSGFGFLSRLHGLSSDNLMEVEMVLADGRIVIVNKDEDPGERLSSKWFFGYLTDDVSVFL